MQTMKQRAIAIVGVIALIGLGTGFTAAADAPAQPAVPEKAEVPQPGRLSSTSLSLCSGSGRLHHSARRLPHAPCLPPTVCCRLRHLSTGVCRLLSPAVCRRLRFPDVSAICCRLSHRMSPAGISGVVGIEPIRRGRAAVSKDPVASHELAALNRGLRLTAGALCVLWRDGSGAGIELKALHGRRRGRYDCRLKASGSTNADGP